MKVKDYLKVTEQTISGTSLANWARLLHQNRYRVGWRFLPRAMYVTLTALTTLPFALYERARFDRKVQVTQVTPAPVFIIGHWRSGTTYLHSLMAQDPALAYVSYFQSLLPTVFLGSRGIFRRSLQRVMPDKRRMDEVVLGADLPAEEEFAIANLSPYSILHGSSFPENRDYYARFCMLEGLPERAVQGWVRVFEYFLKKVTLLSPGRRLVLKNPCNTARIRTLLQIFPQARFIHIYRNPYEVFVSTLRMYERLFPYLILQNPIGDYREFVLDLYESIYRKYFQEIDLIPAGHLVEVRYEAFLRQPLEEMFRVYTSLNLPTFDRARERFRAFIARQGAYRPNQYPIDEEARQLVSDRWRLTLERWEYQPV